MKKTDVFQSFDNAETKHMQVVYLNANGFTPKEISKWTDYAVTTIKLYIKKYESLIDKARKFFYRITIKTKKTMRAGKQLCYLFKFYNKHEELICSKVGTTTRLLEQRLKEEIKYYQERGLDVFSGEMCSVIDCKAIPAEGAESIARAYFIRKFPNAFHKNDRFFGVDIPTHTFNKIVNNYLEGEVA